MDSATTTRLALCVTVFTLTACGTTQPDKTSAEFEDPENRLTARWAFDAEGEVGSDARGIVALDGRAANWVKDRERGGVIRMDADCHSLHGGDTKLLDELNSITFTCWLKLKSIQPGRMQLVSKDNSYEWFLNGRASTMNLRLNNRAYDAAEVFLETNRWYHLAVAASPRGKEYYVNGAHVGTAGKAEAIADSTDTLAIGGRASTRTKDRFFGLDGYLDDVCIFDRQLAPEQIRYLVNKTRKKVRRSTLRPRKTKPTLNMEELAGNYHGEIRQNMATVLELKSNGSWSLATGRGTLTGTARVCENRLTLELSEPTPADLMDSRALVAMQFELSDRTLSLLKIRDVRGRETFAIDPAFPSLFHRHEWRTLKRGD